MQACRFEQLRDGVDGRPRKFLEQTKRTLAGETTKMAMSE